jgi:multimeric flavodoxin WrbA
VNALILNGARAGEATVDAAAGLVAEELAAAGWEWHTLQLRDLAIAPCMGCFGCWVRTPGLCVIDDAASEVARRAMACDLRVYVTPVTFGGYSSELKKALDRTIPLISPFFTRVHGEIHHQKRYDRSPSLAVVGLLDAPDPEAEAIFQALVARNALNMHNPPHAAAVLSAGLSADAARAAVQAMLTTVGVTT